jgi:hypothetical protein
VATLRQDFVTAVMNPNWVWLAMTAFVGVVFMMFGFTAVYSRLYKESGALGFAGYIVIEAAYLLQACKVTWEICLYPVIASNPVFAPLLGSAIILHSGLVSALNYSAMGAIFTGIVLFCTALIRSKEFPKAGGILIFTGALIYGFGPMLSVVVAISGISILSIGCLILGAELMRSRADAV